VAVPEALVEAGYALAIGLAVGFEREHSDLTRDLGPGDVPEEKRPAQPWQGSPMGARTFAIIALVGWLAGYLGDRYPAITPLLIGGLLVMITVQYVLIVKAGASPGMTTEVAGVVVALLGMLVHVDRGLAVPLALATILLLVSKPWTRGAMVRLRRIEIIATVQLLVLAAIVLPLLPADPIDRWDAIPPRKVGIFVVVVGAVEYAGYVLHRLLGARRGTGIAGVVGGLVSSTAVTAAMAREAKKHPELTGACQLATLLASAVMGVRVTVVTALLAPAVAWRLAPAMGALVAALVVAALLRVRAGRNAGPVDEQAMALKNPFALLPALQWGAMLCGVLLITRLATDYVGERGILLAAGAAGLADVDAIVLAASRQASDGGLSADVAALAISIAAGSNQIVKAVIALAGGGRKFGVPIAIAFGVAVALAAGIGTVGVLDSRTHVARRGWAADRSRSWNASGPAGYDLIPRGTRQVSGP
jgi:uncharacterized membrane protein (DUF4010 family)